VGLRHLEYFVAVAAELNFSRAAQRIHVVQSAVSASVSRLEKELRVELLDRSKRQITLTAAGVHPVSAYEVADSTIAAELIRHRLASAILSASAANRFPDLPTILLHPSITWTLSI
jgi:hypothetical protein